MVRVICLMGVTCLALGGCAQVSESRFNPLNWFGEDAPPAEDGRPQQIARDDLDPLVPQNRAVRTVDARPLIAEITALEVTPTTDGILVRASGRAAVSGAYGAQLTTVSVESDAILLDFRIFEGGGSGGRQVDVARALSQEDLGSARTVAVRGANNTLSQRR